MIPIPFLLFIIILQLCYKFYQKTVHEINRKYYEFHFGENEHEMIEEMIKQT